MRRALAVVALLLGVSAAVAGARTLPELPSVGARELAREIRSRRSGLVLVDLRTPDAFAADALPTAYNTLPSGPAAAGGTVVLYGGDAARIASSVAALRKRGAHEVRVLAGGADGWTEQVLSPALPADTRAWSAADTEVAALSAYFGGKPRAVAPGGPPPPAQRRHGC